MQAYATSVFLLVNRSERSRSLTGEQTAAQDLNGTESGGLEGGMDLKGADDDNVVQEEGTEDDDDKRFWKLVEHWWFRLSPNRKGQIHKRLQPSGELHPRGYYRVWGKRF